MEEMKDGNTTNRQYALLPISWRLRQWKNFENRPAFDKVMRRILLTLFSDKVISMTLVVRYFKMSLSQSKTHAYRQLSSLLGLPCSERRAKTRCSSRRTRYSLPGTNPSSTATRSPPWTRYPDIWKRSIRKWRQSSTGVYLNPLTMQCTTLVANFL